MTTTTVEMNSEFGEVARERPLGEDGRVVVERERRRPVVDLEQRRPRFQAGDDGVVEREDGDDDDDRDEQVEGRCA